MYDMESPAWARSSISGFDAPELRRKRQLQPGNYLQSASAKY
jgi:hypothetical protein